MLKIMQSEDNQNGAILMSALLLLLGLAIAGLVLIWLISTIAQLIVPLAIFLILAIVLVIIVKRMLYGGESLGIIKGLTGVGREVGKESVGLMKGAQREYREYKQYKEK